MAIFLGLCVSVLYGAGDFLGGMATKRTHVLSVIVGSFAVATAMILVSQVGWGLLGDGSSPVHEDLWLGAAVGVIGPMSLGLLYHGLASGRMSVVAPITAVVAAIVPLLWGLATEGWPSPLALVGVVVALLAVGLVSGAPEHADHPVGAASAELTRVVPSAALSGFGFGVIYVLLAGTSADAGLWPLVVARPIALTVTVLVAIGTAIHQGWPPRTMLVAKRAAWPWITGAGILDITANIFYLAAANTGLLSIVGVTSSLYPAATVVLARVVLGERLHRIQILGLALALTGIVAMAAG